MRNFKYHAPVVIVILILLALVVPGTIKHVSDNNLKRDCIENSQSDFCQTMIETMEIENKKLEMDHDDVYYTSEEKEKCAKQTDDKLTEFCRVLNKNYETGNLS